MSTQIRWTDATWNPVTGCSKVSPGCEHCYAERLSNKQYKIAVADGKTPEQIQHAGWTRLPWTAPNAAENVILHYDRMDAPIHWKKPKMVFVNSMSDLFHEQVPFNFIDQIFNVMNLCQNHTFQILTKRPDRVLKFQEWIADNSRMPWDKIQLPLINVWMGTSVEDQRRADERIPLIVRQRLGSITFLSCEPLLGSINLNEWLWEDYDTGGFGPNGWPLPDDSRPSRAIDWLICGGESGPGFREMDPNWARSLRDQCVASGIPFFFKQESGYRSETGQELDGVRWEQYPEKAV